jgi:membrane protein YqaA with SNARE-associated domain
LIVRVFFRSFDTGGIQRKGITKRVRPLIRIIARSLFRAGGLGVLTLGAFDSSPLIVPLGNDLLVLALCARYHDRMPYYAAMATLGSLIGTFATVWLSGKGAARLKKVTSGPRGSHLREQVQKRAGWSLVFASLMPPPFPFTAVVAAAAAFRYPQNKLFSAVGAGRFARFVIEGALAIHYGRWIIRQARSPKLEDAMIALIVISVVASAVAMYQWSQKSKEPSEQVA